MKCEGCGEEHEGEQIYGFVGKSMRKGNAAATHVGGICTPCSVKAYQIAGSVFFLMMQSLGFQEVTSLAEGLDVECDICHQPLTRMEATKLLDKCLAL